jgi:hypothetical protein
MAIDQITISESFTTQFEVDRSNTRWVFEEGISGTNSSTYVIYEDVGFVGTEFALNCHLASETGFALYTFGTDTVIKIGENALITGQSGIALDGVNQSVENNGAISTIFGISVFTAGCHVVNNGIITGSASAITVFGNDNVVENFGKMYGNSIGVMLQGDGNQLTLHKGSELYATQYAIACQVQNNETQTITVVNEGLISAKNGTAFSGANQTDIVMNSGRMVGEVRLWGSDDTYDGRRGIAPDGVFGGFGDDTFIVDSNKTVLFENAVEGTDTIKSTVTISLSSALYGDQEFERLVLIGKKNTNATGNELENDIIGNSGDNILKGLGGSDTFVLLSKCGQDVVADFTVGVDVIELTGFKGITNQNDLLKNHVKFQNGDLVIFAGKDEVRFDGVEKNELKDVDFVFDL